MSDHKVILNDHKALDFLLRDLRIVCTWDMALIQQHTVRVKLAQDIRKLKDSLRRHFATEESGAYLEEITIRRPSARNELLELHKQHVPFLNRLTDIEEDCNEHDRDAISPENLTVRISTLLDMLKSHEQQETALLQQVFADIT